MLHDPRPRTRRRGRRYLTAPRRLSVTLDTLRADTPFLDVELEPGHWLIIARDEIDYDDLARAYGDLPGWVRARMFPAVGVVDPAEDLAAYLRTRWWEPGWTISPTSVHLLEDAAPGVTPFHHAWLN